MKTFQKALCVIFALLTVSCLCACGGGDSDWIPEDEEKSLKKEIHDAVETLVIDMEDGATIDGNEIKKVSVSITNYDPNKRITGEGVYLVNGRVTLTDVYGTKYENTFECSVHYTHKQEGVVVNRYSAKAFEYTNSRWTKK